MSAELGYPQEGRPGEGWVTGLQPAPPAGQDSLQVVLAACSQPCSSEEIAGGGFACLDRGRKSPGNDSCSPLCGKGSPCSNSRAWLRSAISTAGNEGTGRLCPGLAPTWLGAFT